MLWARLASLKRVGSKLGELSDPLVTDLVGGALCGERPPRLEGLPHA